ncbi:MAG: V-type ATPase subunit [Alkaliphilus sp.]|nr:V-type ATPase subunit [Alkaliphilus sp.]
MSNVQRFSAINTKAMSLEGRLLKKKDYDNLILQKNVVDFISYLKNQTAYKEVLETVDVNNYRVEEVEVILRRHMVKQYKKLTHYLTGHYKKLFNVVLKRFEIEDIKLYLRAIMRNEDLSDIEDLIICSDMDYMKLSGSKNLEDFIERLKGKDYYRLLKPYLEEEPNKRLFYMEMVLDRLYFNELSNETAKLDTEDRIILGEFLGINKDLLNLQWIYRGIKFYKDSPEELVNYALLGGHKLNYAKIKALCYSKNEDELIAKMIDSQYGFLFDNKETLEIFMERRMQRYLYFLLLKFRRQEKLNIIGSMVYIHLLEYETRDIISIIEAIKYKMEPEVITKFLIRKI